MVSWRDSGTGGSQVGTSFAALTLTKKQPRNYHCGRNTKINPVVLVDARRVDVGAGGVPAERRSSLVGDETFESMSASGGGILSPRRPGVSQLTGVVAECVELVRPLGVRISTGFTSAPHAVHARPLARDTIDSADRPTAVVMNRWLPRTTKHRGNQALPK